MNVPSATYRIQLSSTFTFKDLRDKIPYLDELGISTIYASPIFEARKGSTHGYDITDPLKINSEIGTLEEFREISKALKERKMSWVQDIVPNHMAFDSANGLLYNVLELGPASQFYTFFDINWQHHNKALKGKIMAPFLGDEQEKLIKKGEINLSYEENGFCFYYYDHKYPASQRSYPVILSHAMNLLKKAKENDGYYQLKVIWDTINTESEEWEENKQKLYEIVAESDAVADAISGAVETINDSSKILTDLLDQQYFKLTHWKDAEKEINYRRFFTINDLICLRMEDEEVFQYYHQFIKELCEEKLIDGLRIDHIDGLFDPDTYLERLRGVIGNSFYLIVEKILEWEEKLPLAWPVEGTSGYVFLANVSNLFTRPDQEKKFSSAYQEANPDFSNYSDLIYNKKVFILKEKMGGELSNLYQIMVRSDLLPEGIKNENGKVLEALTGFLAAFPVYRIYPSKFPLTYRQREVLMQAYETALEKNPKRKQALDYLLSVFMGEAEKDPDDMVFFLQKCQQFTGPLAAKGVEDTAFYIYNKLIAHNEVGDSPHVFGISTVDFHEKMRRRSMHFPKSINATATHDTKRGEDARMRINTLSELPDAWFQHVQDWKEKNAEVRARKTVPDDNEEYFIYQSLIGAWPVAEGVDETFIERTQAYLQKVLREAKVHSDWSAPDEAYEQTVLDFIPAIIQNDAFRKSFDPFCSKVAFFGAIYSLGQCLIKITAPGIPDIYQGTELWDLSYVDPDNRRPVDYQLRFKYLEEMKDKPKENYIETLLRHAPDGRIKMYTLFKALKERRLNQEVFSEGKYLALECSGKHQENVISYIRKLGKSWYIVIVPKFIGSAQAEGQYPVGETIWQDLSLALPEGAPEEWTDIFTGSSVRSNKKLLIHKALSVFPVAFLKAKSL